MYSPAVKYVDRSWEYINRSQTPECGNWDSGQAIGIHEWDSRCSAGILISLVSTPGIKALGYHRDLENLSLTSKLKASPREYPGYTPDPGKMA